MEVESPEKIHISMTAYLFVTVIAIVAVIACMVLIHLGAKQGRRADQAEATAKTYKMECDAYNEYYNATEAFLEDLSESYEHYNVVLKNHKDYVDSRYKVEKICFQ